MAGKVGERLQVTANYDTEAVFDFQNLIKLDYKPTEDDILQSLEVGNVNMPLNSSLIQGAQSLFGVKTQLQFWRNKSYGGFLRTTIAEHHGNCSRGNALNEFSLTALEYEEDKHFFLAQYFRDNYDAALRNYPFINSQVQITRVGSLGDQ